MYHFEAPIDILASIRFPDLSCMTIERIIIVKPGHPNAIITTITTHSFWPNINAKNSNNGSRGILDRMSQNLWITMSVLPPV